MCHSQGFNLPFCPRRKTMVCHGAQEIILAPFTTEVVPFTKRAPRQSRLIWTRNRVQGRNKTPSPSLAGCGPPRHPFWSSISLLLRYSALLDCTQQQQLEMYNSTIRSILVQKSGDQTTARAGLQCEIANVSIRLGERAVVDQRAL